jgi:hypothetical protein
MTAEDTMKNLERTLSLVTTILLVAAGAAAQEAKQPITVALFTSMTYTNNFNDPPDGENQLRAYDNREGELSLDVFEAVVQQKVAAVGDVGFRFDMIAGSALPHVTAASGLFRDPETGKAQDFDLLQAFVSYVAPVGRGLRLDLGKFTALFSYEVIEGPEGWNDAVSHSLIFYSTPQTHTGLRATLPFSDTVTGVLYLVNGCDVVQDNNHAATAGLQLGIAKPSSPFSLAFNYLAGPEQPNDNTDLRQQANLVAKYVVSPHLTLGADLLAGREERSAVELAAATWNGAAVYLRTDLTPRFALTLRAETLDDKDGNRTGTAQRVSEATLVAQLELAKGLYLRAEGRYDHSNVNVFTSDGGATDHQPTLAFNVVWTDPDVITH